MNDTPEAVTRRYHRLLMERPAAERVRMACSMHDAAKAIIRAGIPDDAWETETDLRIELFRRFYRADFTPDEMECIATGWRAHAAAAK